MYMPGRRRTASRPSRTWMSLAPYEPRFVVTLGGSFRTATLTPFLLGREAHRAVRSPRPNRTGSRSVRRGDHEGSRPSYRAPRVAQSLPGRDPDRLPGV